MEALLRALNDGVGQLGLEIPGHVPEKLIDYLGLLNHWNKAFNLTAIRNPEEMVSKHLLDSLAILPYLGDIANAIDIGSGAGLPGIPLALCRPDVQFVLNDSNGKKTRFLTQAKLVLGLDNIGVVNRRVEEYRPINDGREIYFDLVIARAYASSDIIIESSRHLQHARSRILVMQGKLDETLGVTGYAMIGKHRLDVPGLNAERHLLEIGKTG